jgi:hypothetical protein
VARESTGVTFTFACTARGAAQAAHGDLQKRRAFSHGTSQHPPVFISRALSGKCQPRTPAATRDPLERQCGSDALWRAATRIQISTEYQRTTSDSTIARGFDAAVNRWLAREDRRWASLAMPHLGRK